MPYCSQCGVEIDNSADLCPLCGAPVQKFGELDDEQKRYPERYRFKKMSGAQKRLIAWLTLTTLFVTSFLVVLTVNLVLEKRITWGSYALTGIGAGWIYSGLLFLFIRRTSLIIAGNFIVTTGFLALIDVFDGSLDWFLRLGLPIAGMVTVASLLIALFVFLLKRWAALLWSILILLAGVFCIGLDLLVSGYRGPVGMSWSFIVMVSLYPVALLLLFYHIFFRKRLDLKRFFHV